MAHKILIVADYITKPFSLQELSVRIAARLRRDARGSRKPMLPTSDKLLVNLSQCKVFCGEREIPFSKREFMICKIHGGFKCVH